MKKVILILKLLLGAFCLLAILFLGFQLGRGFKFGLNTKSKTITHTEVLLEQVKSSLKLVTVEGIFSEIYDYKSYKVADWSPFKKQALIRVKAKVLIGYDLEGLQIDLDEQTKTLTLAYDPTPQIISVEHDMDYYDIREGSFNHFTMEEYNLIGDRAKAFVVDQAMKSSLPGEANKRLEDILSDLEIWMRELGYKVVLEKRIPGPVMVDSVID